MASVRLTKDLKEQTVKNLLHYTYEEELNELKEKMSKFALKVYNDVFSKKERDLMESLPKGWLKEDDDICVQFGNDYSCFYFDGKNSLRTVASKMGMSYSWNGEIKKLFPSEGRCRKVYENTHKLAEEGVALNEEIKDFTEKVKSAKCKARSNLDSVTTVAAIIKAWPEIKPFVPKYALESVTKTAVALPVKDLNQHFRLPKEERETNESI